MKRLAGGRELLDGPLDDPESLAGNLRDLGRVNRLLGGVTLSLRALEGYAASSNGEALRVLDVGTGAADIPVEVRRRWSATAVAPTFVAVDSRREVLDAALSVTPGLPDLGVDLEVADGRDLPWPDDSFDVGHASLVLHHLDPAEASAFLAELGRVARHGVIVNDLARAPVHFVGAWLMAHLLTTNRLTRNDAPLSVRRAYTVREAGALMRSAGLRPVRVARAPFGHRFAISAVRAG